MGLESKYNNFNIAYVGHTRKPWPDSEALYYTMVRAKMKLADKLNVT